MADSGQGLVVDRKTSIAHLYAYEKLQVPECRGLTSREKIPNLSIRGRGLPEESAFPFQMRKTDPSLRSG
jgi:hypothetical protein